MPKANPTTEQASATSPMPASYEAAMEELERLASELESGAMPLDAVLGGYKRGAVLLQFFHGRFITGRHGTGGACLCSGGIGLGHR